ncbi:MAG: metal ABC transporter permease [Verrucomicrobiota bacterium]
MSYLFGNILLIRIQDLLRLFHNLPLAVCFDERYACISGVPVFFMKFLLLFLTSLAIILMVQILGVMLVIVLFVIPAATAGLFLKRIWWIMLLAGGICVCCVFLGALD